ncbi:MAG: substrate-binding domain-containing protein [Phycisphaerales bacterium]|nr:substrate-binding domain-containing protein [Phycisphaerales bacterium]
MGCKEDTGLDPTATAPAAPPSSYVAVVGAGRGDPFWPIIQASAVRYAEDKKTVEVRYLNPHLVSPQAQIDMLESLSDPRMRGLCVQIIDSEAVRPALEKLARRGVVVVSMIQPAPESIRVGHVGFDQFAIGRLLAEATVEALGGQGDIMILHADPQHPVFGPRLTALNEALQLHPGIHVLSRVSGQGNPRDSRRVMADLSARYPRLSAWVMVDDWPLRDAGPTDSFLNPGCRLITFGGTPSHWPLIEDGTITAAVAAHGGDLGTYALMYCLTALGTPTLFETVYHAPLRIVRAANLEEYKRDWHYWLEGDFLHSNAGVSSLVK